jgi:hypothetical protein
MGIELWLGFAGVGVGNNSNYKLCVGFQIQQGFWVHVSDSWNCIYAVFIGCCCDIFLAILCVGFLLIFCLNFFVFEI